ncbi:AbrB family transcriptional regulator [Rhodalgimonas zhirmunskyi]|uniref:AbrB family transcriptional regulator n=1 Tax=Rhodalgimonas zhirmunskyi TaxID=2964767 RepID=A0AAJ1X510_9RHOB|nr:AbrB family transcriptional regulator [Rhodoalgimonas zhirmunskyi]MDQ2093084.1 AbrB family transcriptional regulator [Rhodoalgimonas zhirmunskyi]
MSFLRTALYSVIFCLLGGAAGAAASMLPLPLPYLLGPLTLTAVLSIAFPRTIPAGYSFPQEYRTLFVSIIGILIGTQVRPELLAEAPLMLISLAGVALFVPLAQAWNYWVFRRLGGYDPATAFYSGAPGGLIESITMGEAAGANISLLITQQFLRIITVIALVPLGLSLWHGEPVGSAAGAGTTADAIPLLAVPIVIATAAAGLFLGRLIRLPAWQLTGAMLLSAGASLAGMPLAVPGWLVALSQVIVGTALGLRFAGISRSMMLRGIGLSFASVVGMLSLGAGFALALRGLTGQDFEVLLITFAPGGINEMALIALSLHANPAFVTIHHIFRITITVLGMGAFARRLKRTTSEAQPKGPT